MRVRALIAAAALAFAVPLTAEAADLGTPAVPMASPNYPGLQPVDVYVPPQTAYIVACKADLAQSFLAPKASDWDAYLVYLKEWSADRPPVHMLMVHK